MSRELSGGGEGGRSKAQCLRTCTETAKSGGHRPVVLASRTSGAALDIGSEAPKGYCSISVTTSLSHCDS